MLAAAYSRHDYLPYYRLLSESVGGQPVRLQLNMPTHHGRAAGTIAGMPVSATRVNEDNQTGSTRSSSNG